MLNERMADALNKQINNEMYSAYLYLSLSSYSSSLGCKRCSQLVQNSGSGRNDTRHEVI